MDQTLQLLLLALAAAAALALLAAVVTRRSRGAGQSATTPDSTFAVSTEGEKICPSCGMGNLWTDRTCISCGSPLKG